MHRLNLNGYEPDRHHEAAVAFCIHAGTDELTSPVSYTHLTLPTICSV